MKPLVYKNTKHSIPNWVPFHDKEPRGIAYETETHFVHIFGKNHGLWVISPGLTVTEARAGTLREWVERVFGAVDIAEGHNEVGHTVKGVWRPGLLFDNEMQQGLAATPGELRLAEQALLLLIQRLDELLHFIEPASKTLEAYSHKARELLILACTEVENYWQGYLRMSNTTPAGAATTVHFVKLLGPLHLGEYVVSLPRYASVEPVRPFDGWSAERPTQSLPWYDAYNKTKHDRATHFELATLQHCLNAVAANVALFCVRFGPFRLFNSGGTLSAFVNQLFSVELADPAPTSFYAPKVAVPANQHTGLICFDSREITERRIVDPLTP